MTRRYPTLILAVLGLWAAPSAIAQSVQLSCATVSQQSISASDKDIVSRYAAEGLALLTSDDPADVQRGRERLLVPLRCPDVSASFRVEYTNALQNGLRSVIASGDDFRATNALLVAGMLASNNAVQAIDSALRPNNSDTVRAAAAVALQHTLREQVTGRARLTSTVVEGAITNAGTRFAAEQSPSVVEAMLVALRVGTDRQSPVIAQSITAIGNGTAGAFKNARAQAEPDTLAWSRAAERAAEILWGATYNAQSRQVEQSESLAVAQAAAQIIAFIRDRAIDDEHPITDEERTTLAKALDSVEGSLILIHSRFEPGPAIDKSMSAAFSRSPNVFVAEADKWIGAQGRLTKAPYRFKAEDLAAD